MAQETFLVYVVCEQTKETVAYRMRRRDGSDDEHSLFSKGQSGCDLHVSEVIGGKLRSIHLNMFDSADKKSAKFEKVAIKK